MPYSHALSSRTILPHIHHSSVGSAVVVADLLVNVLTVILRVYVSETSMDHLAAALKKGRIKDLLIFFPPNRRSDAMLDTHFRGGGLPQVADWWMRKQNTAVKEDIAKAVKEALERENYQPSDVRRNFMSCFPAFSFPFLSFPFPLFLGR